MEVGNDPAVEVVENATPDVATDASPQDSQPAVEAADQNTGGGWADPSDDDALEDSSLLTKSEESEEKPEAKSVKTGDKAGLPKSEPDFPDDLLSQAGLSIEQARKHFGNASELEKALAWQDAQMLAAGRQMAQQAQLAPPAAQQATRPAVPQRPAMVQAQPQTAQDTPPQSRKLELKLDPSVWDEQTIGLMNNLNDHYGKMVDELHQRNMVVEEAMQGLISQQQSQIATQYYDQFDETLNNLDEAYRETFGAGDRFTLDKNSEQYRNRQRLDEAMLAIANGRAQAGYPSLTSQQLFDRALRSEFGNIRDAAVRREVVAKVAKRQSTMIARPTNKKSRPMTADEKAADFVSNFFKDKGITSEEDFGDDYADGI